MRNVQNSARRVRKEAATGPLPRPHRGVRDVPKVLTFEVADFCTPQGVFPTTRLLACFLGKNPIFD